MLLAQSRARPRISRRLSQIKIALPLIMRVEWRVLYVQMLQLRHRDNCHATNAD